MGVKNVIEGGNVIEGSIKITGRKKSPAEILRERRKMGEVPDPLRVRISPELGIVVRWVTKKSLAIRKSMGWEVVSGELSKKIRNAGLDVYDDGTSTSIDSTIQVSNLILVYMPTDLWKEVRKDMESLSEQNIKTSEDTFEDEVRKTGAVPFNKTKVIQSGASFREDE